MQDNLRPAKISLPTNTTQIECSGDWVVAKITEVTKQFEYIKYVAPANVQVDASKIKKLDTVGAWMLAELLAQLKSARKNATLTGLSNEHQTLYGLIAEEKNKLSMPPKPEMHNLLYRLGEITVVKWREMLNFLAFFGELFLDFLYTLLHPRQIQWRSFLNVIDLAGFRALPIIALLMFLIGIVISYQTGIQLKAYGANIYIVSLSGIAVLQEFGPLITAIILAGRTGAAFTSQLGSMKVNQEIDALRTMGLSAMNMLVTPRFFGLLVVVPLLTIWADIFGILGSMIMAKHTLSVNYFAYLSSFPHEVKFKNYLIGMCKTPVFAMIIATVGCFQGFEVGFSAESVGRQTTRSVVQAIFLIIIVDALFSILFGW